MSFLTKPGFKCSTLFRLANFLKERKLAIPIYVVVRIVYRYYVQHYGIYLPINTPVGAGIHFPHPGCIVISIRSRIGNNCTIHQGVTLGRAMRGKRMGEPTIGDRVFIGAGAQVLGAITVGNDVVIGANCVVIDDVPDHSVVAIVPGKVISQRGADGFIGNAWSLDGEPA